MTPLVAVRERQERPSATAAAVLALLALPVLYSPSLWFHTTSPKLVGALVVAGIGLGALVGKRESALPMIYLIAAAISVLLNDQPGLSLWGHANVNTGLVFELALVGAWGVGRMLDARSRLLLQKGIVVAAIVNVGAATLQLAGDVPKEFGLELVAGRPVGLVGNPIHLGALCAAALAPATAIRGQTSRALAVIALAAGVALSGSRAPIAVATGVLAWTIWRNWRLAVLTIACTVAGFTAGTAFASNGGAVTILDRVSGGAPAAVTSPETNTANVPTPPAPESRPLANDVRDPGDRLETWRAAFEAVRDRPFLGRGPGRFMDATTRYRTETIGLRLPDGYFFDAHNVLIERVVTVGLIGAFLWVLWIARSIRSARGPLAVFAFGILAYSLVQPQVLSLLPLGCAALGASSATGAAPDRVLRLPKLATAACGTAAAVVILVGTWSADQARLDFDRRHAERAHRLLPPWPEVSRLRAQPEIFDAGTENLVETSAARRFLREATRRAPDSPVVWLDLAGFELRVGEARRARTAYLHVLRADPWSRLGRVGLAETAAATGDLEEAVRWYDEVVRLWPEDGASRERLLKLESG